MPHRVLLMRLWLALLLCLPLAARAHDVPPSVVSLDIGETSVLASVELPMGDFSTALGLPASTPAATAIATHREQIARYLLEHLHVQTPQGAVFAADVESLAEKQTHNANWVRNDWIIASLRFRAPHGASTETFRLIDALISDRVLSHQSLIYVRRDVRNQLLGESPLQIGVASWGDTALDVDGSDGSWLKGFRKLFAVGLHHIITGPDHLLFLISLLIPASLRSARGRWQDARPAAQSVRAILGVVTGFTIGHSLTLALASIGVVPPPGRAVEILIALSILISSLHALRPLFPRREIWIASAFGLVHGLAFAEVLSGMNFDGTTLAVSLIAFNLGIECMQIAVIAVLLPTMIWLSGTRYRHVFRRALAVFAAACASGWIMERAFHLQNPMQAIVDGLAPPPLWLVASLTLAGLASLAALVTGRRAQRHVAYVAG